MPIAQSGRFLRLRYYSVTGCYILDNSLFGQALSMNQWTILVLGCLRLCLNADFDRLHELANQHRTLRLIPSVAQVLGIADWDDKTFALQTLKDNLALFTPALLARINQAVVEAGYTLLGKKNTPAPAAGRCDSFVVETDVHYPTDITLLYDACEC